MRQSKLRSVLLIDDDEATNFINQLVIEETASVEKIVIHKSGFDALEYLKTKTADEYPHPELIFLDINMPGMDGWEFLDEYEKLAPEQKAKIIVIMLTTSINPTDKQKAESYGLLNNFIHKPLTADLFRNVIKKYFDEDTIEK